MSKDMKDKRILLTAEELKRLSLECVNELHRLPRYDIDAQIDLISQYIYKAQYLVIHNTKTLANDFPELRLILGRILLDRIEN
jgi:hypothetical protein